MLSSLLVLLGLAMLLSPVLEKCWHTQKQRTVISAYDRNVAALSDEAYHSFLTTAGEYNSGLRTGTYGWTLGLYTEKDIAEYQSILDVDGAGMMGYVEIPKLDCVLPIYHGSGEEILDKGIGHIEGSSFPVGGSSTHAVLGGHRAEAGADYFKNLDQLAPGDTFTLHILNEKLTYEVDQIVTVLPKEIEELAITEGEDYCSLVTCTPYGSNTHRLLVRGHRIENN